MDDNQKSVWQLNQKMLVNNLNIGQTAVSIQRYEVRVSLNDDQDLVVFPSTLPDRNVTDTEDLPVGMVVETWCSVEFRGTTAKAADPETTKLIGLFTDWQACMFVLQGYLAAHEVVL